MIDNDKVIDRLSALVKVDFDAIKCYDEAIEELDDVSIRDSFQQFRSDHDRHVTNLSSLIQRMGGKVPERSRGVTGFFLAGFTSIRSKIGQDGAIKAMETNEKLTNNRYEDALREDLPSDVRDQVQQNYMDERRHLEYIQSILTVRTGR